MKLRRKILAASALLLILLFLPVVMALAADGTASEEIETSEMTLETEETTQAAPAEIVSEETSETGEAAETAEAPETEETDAEEETAPSENTEDGAEELCIFAETVDTALEECVVDTDMVMDADFTLAEGKTLTVTEGTLTVAEGVTLANNGCIRITGGALVVENGAELDNAGFIEVCENGNLTVSEEAVYTAEETGVLSLNVCAEDSEAAVAGIETALYEYTVPAHSASELLDAVNSNVYAFKTVCISDFAIMAEMGVFNIGENIAISFIG